MKQKPNNCKHDWVEIEKDYFRCRKCCIDKVKPNITTKFTDFMERQGIKFVDCTVQNGTAFIKGTEPKLEDCIVKPNNHITDVRKKVNNHNKPNNWELKLDTLFQSAKSVQELYKEVENLISSELQRERTIAYSQGMTQGYIEGVNSVKTSGDKLKQIEREKVLEEVKEIIKNKSGIPIFFNKGDDLSENNPHYKAICYYLNQLRHELISKLNDLKKK